jgi:mono/diheme cytochrome c family protein
MLSLKMMRGLSLVFLASLLLLGCSRKNGSSHTASASPDSISAADSSKAGPATAASIRLTYEQRQGKNVYTKYCFVCHGMEGKGDGFNSFSLDPKPRDLSNGQYMKVLTDERLIETVREGGRGVNRSPLMPTWGGRLTKDELMYVVAYVRTFAVNNNAHE